MKAMLSVNRGLIQLYWEIGREIIQRQEREGWGKGIADRLAADIQRAFPGLQGFLSVNVWRMRAFYLAYRPDRLFLSKAVTELAPSRPPGPVADIPWGHNQILLFKRSPLLVRFEKPGLMQKLLTGQVRVKISLAEHKGQSL